MLGRILFSVRTSPPVGYSCAAWPPGAAAASPSPSRPQPLGPHRRVERRHGVAPPALMAAQCADQRMDHARDLSHLPLVVAFDQTQQVQTQHRDFAREPFLRERLRVVFLLGSIERAGVERRRGLRCRMGGGMNSAELGGSRAASARLALPGEPLTPARHAPVVLRHRPRLPVHPAHTVTELSQDGRPYTHLLGLVFYSATIIARRGGASRNRGKAVSRPMTLQSTSGRGAASQPRPCRYSKPPGG